MKKTNNTKKYLNYILSLISFFVLFILIQGFAVYADTNLNLDEKGSIIFNHLMIL